MNTIRSWGLILPLMGALSGAASLAEPVGTAFTYQGQLKRDGTPVNDEVCGFWVGLWTVETGGTELGGQNVFGIDVQNGLFTVRLNESGQFGPDAFNGERRWLDIKVCCGSLDCQQFQFTPLGRQEVTPAPYALRAVAGGGGGTGDGHSLDAADGAPVDAVFVDNVGDVGIGRTDPAAKLHVNGNIKVGAGAHGFNLREVTTADPGWGDLISWGGIGIGSAGGANGQMIMFTDGAGADNIFTIATREGLSAAWNADVVITQNGRMGIRTTDPQAALHVEGTARVDGLMTFRDPGDQGTVWINPNAGGGGAMVLLNNGPGQKTIELDADANDDSILRLFDAAGNTAIRLHSDSFQRSGEISLYALDSNGALQETVEIIASESSSGGLSSNGGQITLRNSTGATTIVLDAEHGDGQPSRIITDVLQITGADLAERFPASETADPGIVMEIDPDQPGKLRVARGAYNRRVAGVVSGANGLSVGVVLGHLPGHEDAPPIAMSGRVYVWADASKGPHPAR